LDALRNACYDVHKSTIERLLCYKLESQICDEDSSRWINEDPAFLLHVPIVVFSNLVQCLDKFFESTTYNAQTGATHQYFIHDFPRFLFIRLAREVWNEDHVEKDIHSIAFPLILHLNRYASHYTTNYTYNLVGVIAHIGGPDQYKGHYITFLNIFGQLILFNDRGIVLVNEKAAVEDNFPENDGSEQTAVILLYVSIDCNMLSD
jgi:uncharacterized UBP type Zn finger protein